MAKIDASNRKVKVAMIGAGGMANYVHYPSLASLEDVEFAGICDIDTERMNTTGDKYGIEKRYTDYRKMIEETAPDAVYAVGLPTFMYPVWVWCLEQGMNMFVEKPLGITSHQANILAYLAEQNNCITQVGFQRRNAPIAVKMKEECEKKGQIFHSVCEFYKFHIVPYTQAADRLVDDGIHAVDTIRWMCGGEVVKVHSQMKKIGVPDNNYVSAIIEFDNGSTGILLNTWASGRRVFRLQMHAPGAVAEVDIEGKASLYLDGDTTGTTYDTKEVSGGEEFYEFGGFKAKNREFIDSLKSGKPASSNFADAVKTIELAETIVAQNQLSK